MSTASTVIEFPARPDPQVRDGFAHIMRKLDLETRAELVMFALANGVIGPDTG